ncbi:hypothetical protein [Frateuria sp. STR12]|uniref:hypothetical protein n=1 Tax=Frateuria hangzhouensis TaxID=2995589 RepID=UPI0022609E86|nr:hypothetical protein [Frateuria sp. STR12]MCX7513170.1 hypothetical protein [Frateuria sp. STR12]
MTAFVKLAQPEFAGGLLYFDKLCDYAGVLQIKLRCPSDKVLSVSFDDYFLYRKVDEGDALTILAEVAKSDLIGQSLYEVLESSLVNEFMNQAYGIRCGQVIRHFLILTDQDVIDVLAISSPSCELEVWK